MQQKACQQIWLTPDLDAMQEQHKAGAGAAEKRDKFEETDMPDQERLGGGVPAQRLKDSLPLGKGTTSFLPRLRRGAKREKVGRAALRHKVLAHPFPGEPPTKLNPTRGAGGEGGTESEQGGAATHRQ